MFKRSALIAAAALFMGAAAGQVIIIEDPPPPIDWQCDALLADIPNPGGAWKWTAGLRGHMRDGIADAVHLEATPLTCAQLGLDANAGVQARWIYLTREDQAGKFTTHRVTPNGAPCNAELTGDGVVNTADLGVMRRSFFLRCHRIRCAADLNGDGVVNTIDLGRMAASFFRQCEIGGTFGYEPCDQCHADT